MAENGALSNRRDGDDNSENDETSEPQAKPLQLDLGDDLSHEMDSNRLGNAGPSGSTCNEVPRREDNPFSFKHFLRGDVNNPYQNKGARPKVYCNSTQNESRGFEQNETTSELKASRKVTEYPSVLPDFVQDHLVIEQCYLGSNTNNDYNIDVNNLPDFTPARNTGRLNFDTSPSRDSANVPIPLDLPGPPHGGFPFDLPASSSGRNNLPLSEVGNSKSLPDFLADSAVCSQISDSTVTNSPEGDSNRIRQELDITKAQLSEQTRLCEILRQELILARNKEHEYTQNLAIALGKVEENLEKSNRRATTAENTVLKLRQEVKALTIEISGLRMENESLKCEEASGGHGYYSPSNQLHSHRLAQELRAAASTAEHSLRQLLTGVDNLRIMASSLENMHRIEEKNDPFSQFDEGAGPAL